MLAESILINGECVWTSRFLCRLFRIMTLWEGLRRFVYGYHGALKVVLGERRWTLLLKCNVVARHLLWLASPFLRDDDCFFIFLIFFYKISFDFASLR